MKQNPCYPEILCLFPESRVDKHFFGLVRAKKKKNPETPASLSSVGHTVSVTTTRLHCYGAKAIQTKCKQMDVARFQKELYLWTLKVEFHKMFMLQNIILLLIFFQAAFARGLYTHRQGAGFGPWTSLC